MKIPNLERDATGKTFLIQLALRTLGFPVEADNWNGPKTERALAQFTSALESEAPAGAGEWHKVKASSFADPGDVVAFERCKRTGKSDMQCFAVGDNGIGAWGHKTAQTVEPMAALPREIWKLAGRKGGDALEVRIAGKVVRGILGDTMPSLANIKNGAGIDLNPAFQAAFGFEAPFMVEAEWRWA